MKEGFVYESGGTPNERDLELIHEIQGDNFGQRGLSVLSGDFDDHRAESEPPSVNRIIDDLEGMDHEPLLPGEELHMEDLL